MEIYIPAECGPNFAALLSADPSRRRLFRNIVSQLEPDGRLGDRARAYIVANHIRRGMLRTILSAIGHPFPAWAREGRAAERENADFLASYRG